MKSVNHIANYYKWNIWHPPPKKNPPKQQQQQQNNNNNKNIYWNNVAVITSHFPEWKYSIFARTPLTCKVALISSNRQNAFS